MKRPEPNHEPLILFVFWAIASGVLYVLWEVTKDREVPQVQYCTVDCVR